MNPRKRVFTLTLYIVLPTNIKNVQIITSLVLNHALLLVRYLSISVQEAQLSPRDRAMRHVS